MPLRLNYIKVLPPAGHVGPDNWLNGRQPEFINSTAFHVLKQDLRRYINRDVPGRAYLLAGHRGAGKTALVRRAVEDLRFEILSGPVANQRPVLVKLHGPSLFSGELPAPRSSDSAHKGAPTTSAEAADPLRAALAQITVALYRAVANEVVEAFRYQVMPVPKPQSDSRKLELAALFNLELDNGSTAAVLRGFWQKLDRLVPGVLWPADWNEVRPDQGLREIVAIATAAQAFQVCIGAIEYKTTASNSNSATATLKTGLTLEAGPALNRLAGLLGGAIIGGGLAAGGVSTVPAAAAALVTGLIGAATLSANATRSRDRAQSDSYEFIRDYSITTLERDLPVVIERLRNAGLTPVFLVDELDKLDPDPDSKKPADADALPARRLDQLINRLKNLTTDYGFFCFLANRDYYQYIRNRTRAKAYPREHTYFSNLQFVVCPASEQLRYVLRVVTCVMADDDRDAPAHWMALAFAIRLRARMNVIDLVRALDRHFDGQGAMRPEYQATATLPRYRLASAVQMGIDLALSQPDIVARIEDDPLFLQRAVDALYRLPTAWEADEPFVSLAESDIKSYLIERSVDFGTAGDALDYISGDESRLLSHLAIEAARTLADFTIVNERAKSYWTENRRNNLLPEGGNSATEEQAINRFPSIMPASSQISGVASLVSEDPNCPGKFIFLLDRFGAQKQSAAAPLADDPPLPGQRPLPRERALIAAAKALVGDPANKSVIGALPRLHLTVPFLKEVGILSAAVPDERAIEKAIVACDLAASLDDNLRSESQPLVESFVESCVQAAPYIAWASLLIRSVSDMAERLATVLPRAHLQTFTEDAVRAGIARHVYLPISGGDLAEITISQMWDKTFGSDQQINQNDAAIRQLILPRIGALDASAVEQWRSQCSELPKLTIDTNALTADYWPMWRDRIRFAADPRLGPLTKLIELSPKLLVSISELTLAARGIPPGSILRNYNLMSTLEWSDLALKAFRDASELIDTATTARGWAIVAALYALGFGNTVTQSTEIYRRVELTQDDFEATTQFINLLGQRPDPRLHLLYIIESSSNTIADEPPPKDGGAVFAVRRADLNTAQPLLDFLSRSNQFKQTVL